ncbi:hypothetical protein ANO11243_004580 [Dothideomycetidae sp. 11243]|nr:hypothetical protein ANO11243_004580 [fungal sp. No.11243]
MFWRKVLCGVRTSSVKHRMKARREVAGVGTPRSTSSGHGWFTQAFLLSKRAARQKGGSICCSRDLSFLQHFTFPAASRDVSHLLTHIASKGHLSTYYKIKVQSSTEDEARNLIEEYDTWYATWRIESLMSERMKAKESRRQQRALQCAVPASASGVNEPPLLPSTEDFNFGDSMDPLLEGSEVKRENEKHSASLENRDQTSCHPSNAFTTPPWLPDAYHHDIDQPRFHTFELEEADEELRPDFIYSPTPSRLGHLPHNADLALYDTVEDGVADEVTRIADYSRLKGVLWPGMDMFDSATPEMRRKRNQKKSTDVVERLEALSKEIEATEVVYSAHGVIQKSRAITGFPHLDSSPVKGEYSPSPKKPRQSARRKPLAPINPNVGTKAGPTKMSDARRRGVGRRSKRVQDENQMESAALKASVRPKTASKRKPSPEVSASPALSNGHTMDYLTSAFQYKSPDDGQRSTADFRSALDWSSYNQIPFLVSAADSRQLSTEPTLLPAWDFLGQDVGASLMNPLFIESNAVALECVDDDPEKTITAPNSDS